MKKLFNLFICLLLCFSFISLVNAEDGIKLINEEYIGVFVSLFA